jgi:anaerobic selenocysteine-containing dehydrogenase
MNAERRIQRIRKAIEPVGQSKSDWKSFVRLLKQWAKAESFSYGSAEDIWNEIRSVWPAGRGITYERLDGGGLQWPCPDDGHSGTEVMHTRAFPLAKPRFVVFLIVQPMKLLTKSFLSADYRKNSLPVQRWNDDDAYSKCEAETRGCARHIFRGRETTETSRRRERANPQSLR